MVRVSLDHPEFIVPVRLLFFGCSVMSDSGIPWTVVYQGFRSFTISWSLLKVISIESMMPSNYLILSCPLLPLPSIFPSIRVFSNESVWPKYWSFSFSISPSNEYSELIFFMQFFYISCQCYFQIFCICCCGWYNFFLIQYSGMFC